MKYHYIAPYYDYILKHVDYDEWYRYLRSVMCTYINNPRTVLELGCGTGKFGPKFSLDDYEIYGMDKSHAMLQIAKIRAFNKYRIFCGDIRQFSLSKPIDFIFSVHDTFNYILDDDDMAKALCSVRDCMSNTSVFLFDITTEHNIMKNFHGKQFSFKTKNTDIQWNNTYDKHSRMLSSTLAVASEGKTVVEEHIQRLYAMDEIVPMISKSGLDVIDIVGDYTFEPPHSQTIMINFIIKRKAHA